MSIYSVFHIAQEKENESCEMLSFAHRKKLSLFRVFWPFPPKFIPAKSFKILFLSFKMFLLIAEMLTIIFQVLQTTSNVLFLHRNSDFFLCLRKFIPAKCKNFAVELIRESFCQRKFLTLK